MSCLGARYGENRNNGYGFLIFDGKKYHCQMRALDVNTNVYTIVVTNVYTYVIFFIICAFVCTNVYTFVLTKDITN